MPRRPRTPSDLAAGGRALWSAVLDRHELRPDELRVLLDACREADLIDEMENEQKGAPKTARGSMGQPVAAPLISELRQHRATLTTMLRALALDKARVIGAVDAEQAEAEQRQRDLAEAQQRWTSRRSAG